MENLYLIRLYNEKENFYKIGTTVHRYCRFYEIMKAGYSIEIIYMIMGVEFYSALNYETILQNMFYKNKYKPMNLFGGYTECFSDVDINKYKLTISHLEHKEIVEKLQISWR